MTTETLRTQRKTVLKKNCLLRDLSVSVVWVRFWLQWILLPARRFGGWEAGETITTETPRGTERSLRDLCVSVVWVWFSFLVAASRASGVLSSQFQKPVRRLRIEVSIERAPEITSAFCLLT